MGIFKKKDHEKEMTEVQKLTFTKRMVIVLLIMGIIDVQFSYILALLGRDPAQELSIAVVTEILGVSVAYMVKAFFGKKEEEKTRLMEQEMELADSAVEEDEEPEEAMG